MMVKRDEQTYYNASGASARALKGKLFNGEAWGGCFRAATHGKAFQLANKQEGGVLVWCTIQFSIIRKLIAARCPSELS
jgi:hypothetical protein